MKFFEGSLIFFLFILGAIHVTAQEEVVYLKNPSFEGVPRAGGTTYPGISAAGWIDCGRIMFPAESPPDIHPGEFFNVSKAPQDGRTYIGLVARENESWESVSQLLSEPLKAGNCYSVNLHLARSANYVNRASNNPNDVVKAQNKALVLRIYGGLRPCEKKQILAESELVTHTDWRNYSFDFEVNANTYYITFEAFYKTPVLLPYNGNLLLDNISPITRIACPDEPPLVAETEVRPPPSQTKAEKEEPVETPVKPAPEPPIVVEKVKKEKTITQELNSDNIIAGQTIEINNLYFEADTSNINSTSYGALNEVYDFLQENPKIRIEIGGHTNGTPPDWYCDKLSTQRAKAVATYMIRKGIKPSRLEFKGYGKRKPIASNKTKEGRKRNQRVEITILNVD